MPECWLRNNPRTVLAALVVPVVFLAVSGALAHLAVSGGHRALTILAALFAAVGILIFIQVVSGLRSPRLGYERGMLLVYLRGSRPFRVPVDLVECFFRGQAPARVGRRSQSETETATVVVRLAESASQWQQRDVHRALGQWCDGYIVIRGTWCEPIDAKLMEQLNRRLVEVHRQHRQENALGI